MSRSPVCSLSIFGALVLASCGGTTVQEGQERPGQEESAAEHRDIVAHRLTRRCVAQVCVPGCACPGVR